MAAQAGIANKRITRTRMRPGEGCETRNEDGRLSDEVGEARDVLEYVMSKVKGSDVVDRGLSVPPNPARRQRH